MATFARAALISAMLASLGLATVRGSSADDTEILRLGGSNPYLFVLLDSSRSMAASVEDHWLPAGADDPRSRLYLAKEVLYEELQGLSGVNFGLATFAQDEIWVTSKHYLYFVADTPENRLELSGMPESLDGYPRIEPGNSISTVDVDPVTGADETRVEIDGDLLTLGRTFPFDGSGRQVPQGGTCQEPLDLSVQRDAVNRYPRLGTEGASTVTMWVKGAAGRIFRLVWKRPATALWKLGDAKITVKLNVLEAGETCGGASGPGVDHVLELRLWRPFLWVDDERGAEFDPSGNASGGGCGDRDATEISGGFWNLGPLDVDVAGHCGAGCAIDRGSMVPWHWTSSHRDAVLARLNPNHGAATEDFGVANYFADPLPGAGGSLQPRSPNRRPIAAAGNSPIAAAVREFRCWFFGEGSPECEPRNSCSTSYGEGLRELLAEQVGGRLECREPFLIVVTDLHGNCADPGDLASAAGTPEQSGGPGWETGVNTWILNLGPKACEGWTGGGQVIHLANRSELRRTLRGLLGEIEESARSFAAAAVPAVQADVADKIYFTQFTPLQNAAIWPGEVLAFRKPLPTTEASGAGSGVGAGPVPDRERKIWDAGLEMLDQAPAPDSLSERFLSRSQLKIGAQESQRRVVYMVESGLWNYFAPVETARANPVLGLSYSPNALRNQLWRAMGLTSGDVLAAEALAEIQADASLSGLLASAHSVFRSTLVEKEAVTRDGQILRNYVLGDIFHSNPQVLGGPVDALYLSNPDLYPDYETFARRHARRRKVLFVGANDGMLHAFDAGRWEGSFETGSFNDGSGREIFGYVPRDALPGLTSLRENSLDHRWFVDGTPQLADVRIDVSGDGLREWRTVLLSGLRRGGSSLFALDVTQPDPVAEVRRELGGTSVQVGYLPTRHDVVPACWDRSHALPAGETVPSDGQCDAASFGLPLWELRDDRDEDQNGRPDMGQTWSAPEIGAIRVFNTLRDAPAEELRWVAIFGGGLDPDWAAGSVGGNWLYIADLETGGILYKRRLGEGSAAASPVAVDTDHDGVLDRVYIGTTYGQLWRVDMSTAADLVAGPAKCAKSAYDEMCIDDNDPLWDPVLLFDTLTLETTEAGEPAAQRRPLFIPPTVFYIGQLGEYGVALGTGDRDHLWAPGPAGGNRFYVFADEACKNSAAEDSSCLTASELPLFEDDLTEVTAAGGGECSDDVITDVDARELGKRGWFFKLGVTPLVPGDAGGGGGGEPTMTFSDPRDELLVAPTVTISGLTVWSTFVAETRRTQTSAGAQCSRGGSSRRFVYSTANGCELSRTTTEGLAGELFLDRKQTQNPSCEEDPSHAGCSGESDAEDLCEAGRALSRQIREDLFPSTCRFSDSLSFPLMASQGDTGLECVVEIPVCIQQRNWKEF